MEVLDSAFGHKQTTLSLKILPAGRLTNDPLAPGSVVGMKSFQDETQCGLNGRIEFKDSKSFVGPNDFACLDRPPEASRLTKFLGLGKVCFAATEFLSQELVQRNVYGSANDSFQRPILDNRSTNATHEPNVAVGSHNPLRDITTRGFCKHSVD